MKKGLLCLALTLAISGANAPDATASVNLTPTPKSITEGTGQLTLPASFSIKANGLTDEMAAEVTKFASALKAATGIDATAGDPLFEVSVDETISPEGYKLNVTSTGVEIKASASAGLFYAFQTIKKVLPPNVMAAVEDTSLDYSLPVMQINDEPRYPWRGMEIDCARHFFEIDQLKKMIDVMAAYKMNRFHWHLTDDQGWRLEMPKYPKLTTAAASPLNNYWCDFDSRHSYLLNEPYGPYFYTVEEMKDLVAYAKERHIEICPEIDMPGHMQAAIAAYPEFSTTPNGDHPVRFWPGVSTDVLDVSNPAVVRFTKDIIDQLAEIFPYEYIHIGGDECPTTAWAKSPACQQFKKDYGLNSDRAIQNWLTKELADYAKQHDRKLICWNEVLTTDGADKKMVKEADIMIYAWLGAGGANNPSKQAADLGLRSVWCSTSHYYIDYPQWSGANEPLSMGHAITLETVYKATPDYEASKSDLYYGVNCNLWTEYISENEHLEYNALPRMIAVAETGWTPAAKKDWNSFLERFNADTRYLDLGGYTYGRHYVTAQESDKEMPAEGKYYRIITRATNQGRQDRCIELVTAGSPLIGEFSAAEGTLWTSPQAAEGDANFDYQHWTFEADPAGSGKYAMVCRALPGGSLNAAMTGASTGARWTYSADTKNYNFVLGDYYGDYQGQHTYSIRSDRGADHYLSAATQGDKLSVNNWARPDDGDGGIWFFNMEGFSDIPVVHPAFTPLEAGNIEGFINAFSLQNALDPAGESNLFIAMNSDGIYQTNATTAEWGHRLWVAENPEYNSETNVQTFKLRNAAFGLYTGAPAATAITSATEAAGSFAAFRGNLGFPVSYTANADEAVTVSMYLAEEGSDEFILSVSGSEGAELSLFPISDGSEMLPGKISAISGATRQQGGRWKVNKAPVLTYNVTFADESYPAMVFRRQKNEGEQPESVGSPLENYRVISCEATNGSTTEFNMVLERENWTVTYECVDARGQVWGNVDVLIPAKTAYTPAVPEIAGLKNGRFAEEQPAFTPDGDKTIRVVYETEAYPGVEALTSVVTTPEAGKYYLIRDAHADRNAFRCDANGLVAGAKSEAGKGASYVWTLEADGSNWFIRNAGSEMYVQAVKKSAQTTTADKPYAFKITARTSPENTFTIKNSKNSLVWDGNEDLSMVGWDAPGHPIEFYEFRARPVFRVTVEERDQKGTLLASKAQFVNPGGSYVFEAAARPGKALTSVSGNEGLDNIQTNKLITVTYEVEQENGLECIDVNVSGNPVKGIYDLQGRRLSRITRPGVYVIDGRKVTVK